VSETSTDIRPVMQLLEIELGCCHVCYTQLYGSKDENGCKLLLFIVIVVIYVCTCKILLHPV